MLNADGSTSKRFREIEHQSLCFVDLDRKCLISLHRIILNTKIMNIELNVN